MQIIVPTNWWSFENSEKNPFWLRKKHSKNYHCILAEVSLVTKNRLIFQTKNLCLLAGSRSLCTGHQILIMMVACSRIFKDCKSQWPTRWSGAPNLSLAVSLTDCATRHSSFDSSKHFCSQEDLCRPLVVFGFHHLSLR